MKTRVARQEQFLSNIESGDEIENIVMKHEQTADCETVSAILQIHSETLPCIAYILLHRKDHEGDSEVPNLCPDGLRELVELILAVGIETGLRLSGEGSHRWKN